MKRLTCIIFIWVLTACQSSTDSNQNIKAGDKADDVGIQASGVIVSTQQLAINPPVVKDNWQYKIKYMIPEGSAVKKGDLILSFDASQLKQKLAVKNSELAKEKKQQESQTLKNEAKHQQLKLELAKSKMELEKAQRKWQQSKGLSGKREIKQLQLDYELQKVNHEKARFQLNHFIKEAEASQAVSETEINRLENEVNELKQGIEKLNVKAAKKGIVVYKEDHRGDKSVVGDSVWMGRTVMELPSLEHLVVKARIDEVDATNVKAGQRVVFSVDAYPEKEFTGEISELGKVFRPQSREVPSVVFDAMVKIDNLDLDYIKPGMNARLNIKRTLQQASVDDVAVNNSSSAIKDCCDE